jgi:hypothetical protein
MKKLFKMYIDDIRTPKSEFDKIVRSSKEAQDFVQLNFCPDYISFDHDLGGDDTSMIFIKWLIEEDLNQNGALIPNNFTYNVHSANPIGSANIEGYLKSYLTHRIHKEGNKNEKIQ